MSIFEIFYLAPPPLDKMSARTLIVNGPHQYATLPHRMDPMIAMGTRQTTNSDQKQLMSCYVLTPPTRYATLGSRNITCAIIDTYSTYPRSRVKSFTDPPVPIMRRKYVLINAWCVYAHLASPQTEIPHCTSGMHTCEI